MKSEMTNWERTNGLFAMRKRLIERMEMTCLTLGNDLFSTYK